MLDVNIQCEDEKLIPSKGRIGDAGFDLRSSIDATIQPGERLCVPTGIRIELPKEFCAFVTPRSGLALNEGISVLNAPGLIDSNYRGEIGVILINTSKENAFKINKYDRIAQMVIMKLPNIKLTVSNSLNETDRGSDGFGSSGIQ